MANQHPRYSNIYSSFGEAVSGVASVSDGALKVLTVFNTATTDRYIMLFDLKRLPTATDRPLMCFPVYAKNGYTEIGTDVLTGEGLVFDQGLAWGMSVVPNTYAPGAISDAILTLRWS